MKGTPDLGKGSTTASDPAEHAMFSSAAVTLRQRPPARIARMVTVAICVMVTATLAYACLVSMDIVVTAQGRVSASGKSKVIQPLEAGVVKAIAVRDGQAVKAGDVLVELDATATLADRDRLQREAQETQADVLRLQSLLSGKDEWAQVPDLPAAMVANQQAVLAGRRSEQLMAYGHAVFAPAGIAGPASACPWRWSAVWRAKPAVLSVRRHAGNGSGGAVRSSWWTAPACRCPTRKTIKLCIRSPAHRTLAWAFLWPGWSW